jgi:hypothetical protein
MSTEGRRRLIKRRTESYVWCDVHCSIHERKIDVYGEGMTDCQRRNWRAVYVATDDPEETF